MVRWKGSGAEGVRSRKGEAEGAEAVGAEAEEVGRRYFTDKQHQI